MEKIKILYHDELVIEEIDTSLLDRIDYEVDKETIKRDRIDLSSTPSKKFTAFLDGSMRLYKVASATVTRTPFFIASISTALLVRDSKKQLINTPFSRYVNVILFPFDSYFDYLEKNGYQKICEVAKDWKKNLERVLKTSYRDRVFKESEFIEGSLKEIFKENDTWLICDLSYKGIMAARSDEIKKKVWISEEEVLNPVRVKEAARVRARYIMGLLEFYSAFLYLENNQFGYIMVDGLFSPYRRVGKHFKLTKEDYNEIIKNVVGFIKNPRHIPADVIRSLPHMSPGEFIEWKGSASTLESQGEGTLSEEKSREDYKFAVLKFRPTFFSYIPTPIGIVKLQTSSHTEIKEAVEAVFYERYPIPTDKKRLYNEPFPIEVAEKVAKSILPSEARVRGLILSISSYI